MEIDVELMREIMLEIEDKISWDGLRSQIKIDGHSEEEINYYLQILLDEGLIKAECIPYIGGGKCFLIKHITLLGNEFIANTKDPSKWDKVKNGIMPVVKKVTISAIPKVIDLIIKYFNTNQTGG